MRAEAPQSFTIPAMPTGDNVVRIEAQALSALADRLANSMKQPFDRAVELLYRCAGRVVVTGMGKSGIIAQKIAATLSFGWSKPSPNI